MSEDVFERCTNNKYILYYKNEGYWGDGSTIFYLISMASDGSLGFSSSLDNAMKFDSITDALALVERRGHYRKRLGINNVSNIGLTIGKIKVTKQYDIQMKEEFEFVGEL